MKQLLVLPIAMFLLVADHAQAQQSSLVLQRFYMIQRLQKICSLSLFSEPDPHCFKRLEEILPLLKHPSIRKAMSNSINTHSMEPLKQLWHLMCTYHFLDDPLFTQEFTRSLYILFYTSFSDINLYPAYNAQVCINDNAIAYRFYCIERLRYAVACCTTFLFDNPNTKIMLVWWQEYVGYKHILESAYTRGLCVLLIKLLEPSHASKDFSSYSHEQLLDLIDELTDQIRFTTKPSLYKQAVRILKNWIGIS